MFRPSSRLLAKMLAGMTSICCLPKRTWTILSVLGPFHRPLAIQLPKFFASAKVKSSPFKDIKSNAFEIGSTKFIFSIIESKINKEIILSITESDRDTHQHKRHIWLHIKGAKTLLEKLEKSRISTIDRSSAGLYMDVPITKFVDNESQYSIELKLKTVRNGDISLQILRRSLVEDKRSAMLVPLDGIARFQEKLTMIQNCEKLKEPNRPIAFEDLCKPRFFFFEPKNYFLHLSKSRSNDRILLRLLEHNKETEKKRAVFMPIESAETLLSLLTDAYEIIQSFEGRLSAGKQPREVLYEKSFADQVTEYTVQVQVSDSEMRHLGDMVLRIKKQNLDEALSAFIIIRSHGAHLLLEHFEKILQEYGRLKPTLPESEETKLSNLIDEQRKQMRDQELAAWKVEVETTLAELDPKNWKGIEEDRQKEFAKRKEMFAKKLKEIRKKYSDLA